MQNQLDEAFAQRLSQGRKLLVAYLMAADPHPDFTVRIAPKLAAAGVDMLELGFPFSDPVADGPVIQQASQRALLHLHHLDGFLEICRSIRLQSSLPLTLMTYYNPIFRYGEKTLLTQVQKNGISGVIVPDLPLDETQQWRKLAHDAEVHAILLEAPNSDDYHARRVAEVSSGFIYLVSLKGVTGSQQGVGENLQARTQRLRRFTKLPLLAGFGITTAELAGKLSQHCDGVVVGSVLVACAAQAAKDPSLAEQQLLEQVRAMRQALDTPIVG